MMLPSSLCVWLETTRHLRGSLLLLHAARRGVSRGWLGVGLTVAVGGHEPLILSHGFFHC